jgi:hypothetical protein
MSIKSGKLAMKTTPQALRDLADLHARADDPDAATALRWAADDIDRLTDAIAFEIAATAALNAVLDASGTAAAKYTAEVQPDLTMVAAAELLCRHILRKINELDSNAPSVDLVLVNAAVDTMAAFTDLRAERDTALDRAERAEEALDSLIARLDALAVDPTPTGTAELLRAWQRWALDKGQGQPPALLDYPAVATEIEQLWKHNRALLAALAVKVDVITRLIGAAGKTQTAIEPAPDTGGG